MFKLYKRKELVSLCSSLSSAQVMAKRHANPSIPFHLYNPSSPRSTVCGENCQRPTGQMAKGSLTREEPESLWLAQSGIVVARNRSPKGLAMFFQFSACAGHARRCANDKAHHTWREGKRGKVWCSLAHQLRARQARAS